MPEHFIHELSGAPDPAVACTRLAGLRHRVLLESSSAEGGAGRYSFLSADPIGVLRIGGDEGQPAGGRYETRRVEEASGAEPADPFAELSRLLARYRVESVAGLPPFQGGAVGYLGYELGGWLERLPAPRPDDVGLPDMWVGFYDWTIAWDHETGRAWVVSTGLPEGGRSRGRRARARGEAVVARLADTGPDDWRRPGRGGWPVAPSGTDAGDIAAVVRAPRGHPQAAWPETAPVPELPGVRSTFTRSAYLAAVERVRRHILAGDVFQANLTQRLEAAAPAHPLTLYLRLRRLNPSPFAAYLDLGDAAVVSGSPERFVCVRGDAVETRPIKGTAARGATAAEDAELAARLLSSEKDRAENVMIVDLLRNDLSRTCRDGTVRVERLCALERHPTVHHLVSEVTGVVRPGLSSIDVLRAAFPGGSVTGAPKPMAMEILRELEPTRRGVYTGAIGYVGFDGTMDTSIAIRTFVVRDRVAYFGVGGGVVLDSDPVAEYEETLAKARGLVAALGAGAVAEPAATDQRPALARR